MSLLTVCYIVIKKFKNMKIYKNLVLQDVLHNDKNQFDNIYLTLGLEGISKTDLRPLGLAEINGMILDVISDNGYIKNNSKIKIIRIFEKKVYVTLLNDD